MNRLAYIFVPGINSWPGAPDGWTDRAVTWIHSRTEHCAEKFEYLAGALTRRLLMDRRANALSKLVDHYPEDSHIVALVGHSNGCEIIRRAILRAQRPVNQVYLFAPAVSAQARTHKLHQMLADGRIGFLTIFLAGRDSVLTRRFLGGRPPEYVRGQFETEHHTTIHSDPRHGHSTYWAPAHFEDTMRRIAGPFGGTP